MCLSVAYVGQKSPIGRVLEGPPSQPRPAPVSASVDAGPTDLDLIAPGASIDGSGGSAAGSFGNQSPGYLSHSDPAPPSGAGQPASGEPTAAASPADPRPDLSGRSWVRPAIVDAADVGSPVSSTAQPSPASIPSPIATPASTTDSRPALPTATPAAGADTTKTLAPVVYYVVDGDTLSSIAQHFGVSAESIAAASGLQRNEDSLSIHQKLIIPPVPGVIHVVASGETLSSIASRYSADFDQIALANGLKDPFTLQVGQTLVIPDGKVPSAGAISPASSPAPSPTQQPSPTPAPATYTVSPGDSVASIASAFGVDLRAIVSANGLSVPYVLHPGQQIVIPGVTHPPSRPTAAPSKPAIVARTNLTYTVQTGDDLSRIAVTFGVDPVAIVDANGLTNPNAIRPGEQLVIPGSTRSAVRRDSTRASAVATATPLPPTATTVPPTATPIPPSQGAAVGVPRLPAPPTPSPYRSADTGWQIVADASKFLGSPYVWGGTTPRGFDCSGLVWYVYRLAGIPVPRDMWGQLQSGARISRGDLQPGDIVFFVDTYQSGLSHDGIYIGGGRFINAENTSVGVAVASLSNPYWNSRYYGATRPG